MPIVKTNDLSLETLQSLQIEEAEAVITMMDDDDNYQVCELEAGFEIGGGRK